MSKIKNLINQEEDILSSIDEPKYLEKEVEIEHEHLHVDEKVKEEIRKRNVAYTRKIYNVLATIAAIFFVGVLIYGVAFLPEFGALGNPTQNEIVDKYIQDGISNTGATNFVTGMILDYRAFDTLGESFVLFTAVTCVFILLKEIKPKKNKKDLFVLTTDPILRTCCSLIVPIILLFGIYVILNGSISPGGGFSGGAIVGAGLILYSLVFGHEKMSKFFNAKVFKTVTSCSLLCYCLCKGCVSFPRARRYPKVL
jgi:multicomponent Na+:H+ antiporter subunit B